MKKPILTISILISNNYDNVKRCIESIQTLMKAVDSELILTDTGVYCQIGKWCYGKGSNRDACRENNREMDRASGELVYEI